MWLIPSFFRVHIVHSSIVGMTTLIEIAVYKYTIYNVNKESAVYPIDDFDFFVHFAWFKLNSHVFYL